MTIQRSKSFPLWIKMLFGMISGILFGIVASQNGMALISPEILTPALEWIMLPAKMFISLIMMIVMPLVFCSVILAVISSGSFEFFKTTGLKIGAYFVATTTLAVTLGISLSSLINPARFVPAEWVEKATQHTVASAISDLGEKRSTPQMIVDLIPENIISALANQEMLQIVIAAIIIGIALLAMPQKKPHAVAELCESVQRVCMKIVEWTMILAPIAVFGFLFRLVVEVGPEILSALAVYIGTVLLGLICLLIFYLTILYLITRRNPIKFIKDIRNPMVLAFSSSSSAATMPVSLETAETKLKIRPEISKLVIPLGTTINMDGTALYQIIVALFLTNLMGIDLTLAQTALLAVTIIGASIGSPGTPGVGLVILTSILVKLGVPAESIGIILSVDRLLDMFRTTINVTGDLTAAAIMEKLVKKHK